MRVGNKRRRGFVRASPAIFIYYNSISRLSAINELECDIIPFFDQNKSILIEKWNYRDWPGAGFYITFGLF